MQGTIMHAMTTTADDAAPAGVAATPANAGGEGWRLSVLGPVQLSYSGRVVDVAGTERTLLALLSRVPGEEISTATIVAGMWGSAPPQDAEKTVASHVARLRKALTAVAPDVDPTSVIVTMPAGYVLTLAPSHVDISLFERLAVDGRRALEVGQPALAVARLQAAQALWRGAPFADLAQQTFARAEAARLEDLRLAAIEFRVDAQLALTAPSASPAVVAELQALVTEHWHRERLSGLLMTALFRLGRRGDALAAFRQARTRLAEELRAEPGADLRAVERAVIAGDPVLLGTPVQATLVPDALAVTVPACTGRVEELDWLSTALDLAATRRGQARVVVGSPGIGKSRLLAELAQRAAARGVIVRFGQGGAGATDALHAESDRLSMLILDDLDAAPPEDLARVTAFLQSTQSRPVVTILSCRDPVRIGDLASLPKLVLSPLDDHAVAEIVRVYAPTINDATAAAAAVNTGGVPARVHRAASEWAFARAGRRIDRAVADAAERRRWLANMQDEIVAGVLDLAHVRAQARRLRPAAPDVVPCPYKGLARFETADADLFHGREALVAEIVARLSAAPLVAVVGGAGTGKSSLVRAGLLPALASGVLPDSNQWHQILVTPASTKSLAQPLVDAGDGTVLLVVDQFEEVFTALDPAQREEFLTAMVGGTTAGRVVITVRSDFYARCAEHHGLSRLVTANTLPVRPMVEDELRRAIEGPARPAALRFEDGLVDRLVNDAAGASLAELSTALWSLWRSRSGRTLTLAGYVASGGVPAAIKTFAESSFAEMAAEDERAAARRILLGLAQIADGHDAVGRAVDRAALVAAAGASGPAAMDRLAEHRMVTVADGAVELCHEALLSHWPRLRAWVDDEALEGRLGERVAAAASAWSEQGGRGGRLYRGAQLVVALDWDREHPGALGEREHEFLTASQRALLVQETRRRQRTRRLTQWFVATVIALLLAVAVAVVAVSQRLDATSAGSRADAQRLAAQALAEPDLRRATLLAVAGTTVAGTGDPSAIDAVRAALLRFPDVVAAAGDGITAMSLSPDGQTVAAGSSDGAVWFLDAQTLGTTARIEYPGHGPINGLAFMPDGRRLVTWGRGETASIVVWDIVSRAPDGPAFGQIWPGSAGGLLADGGTLLVAQHGENGTATTAVAWSMEARTPSTAYDLPSGNVDGLAVAPDGRRVALGTVGGTLVVELATGVTHEVRNARHPSALSPDGRTLLTAEGGDVVVWDVDSGRREGEARRHAGDVHGTAWSADGRAFASVGSDGLIVVWDARTLRPMKVFRGHEGAVRVARFAADGRTLYTAGDDGSLLSWDLTGTRGVATTLSGAGDPASIIRMACALAARDMSGDEWQTFLPGRPYQHVCPG